MTLAAAASRARSVLALALLVVAALLAVLNPWLAVFAVAGFALGWVVRNPRRLVRCISASVASVRHFRKSRSRLTAGLVGLVSLAVVVLVGVSLTEEQFSFRITTVAPVSYSAKATLDTEREAFVLLERLVVPRESLRLARIDAAPKKPEDFVAQLLVKGGWDDPRLVRGALEVSREGESEVANFGRLTRRATVALPIPDYLGSTINFQLYVTNATVDVIARKHWVLATSPPSEAETLPGSNERRRVVQSEEAVDEGAIQVELAGPLFRSKPGALLLGLSAWDPLFFVVAALFGWLQDALKKLFGGLFGRILRRGGAPTPERPPPAPS